MVLSSTCYLHTIVKRSYKTVQRRIPQFVEEETNLYESHGLMVGQRIRPHIQIGTMYARIYYRSGNGWRCCTLQRTSTQRNGRACLCKQIVQTGTVMVWKLGRGTAAEPLYSAVLCCLSVRYGKSANIVLQMEQFNFAL